MTPTGTTANGRAVSLPWRQKNGLFAGARGSVLTHGRFARSVTYPAFASGSTDWSPPEPAVT